MFGWDASLSVSRESTGLGVCAQLYSWINTVKQTNCIVSKSLRSLTHSFQHYSMSFLWAYDPKCQQYLYNVLLHGAGQYCNDHYLELPLQIWSHCEDPWIAMNVNCCEYSGLSDWRHRSQCLSAAVRKCSFSCFYFWPKKKNRKVHFHWMVILFSAVLSCEAWSRSYHVVPQLTVNNVTFLRNTEMTQV